MVWQVFVQRVSLPSKGGQTDEAVVAAGLSEAARALGALERIAGEGMVLTGRGVTLADCHLAPMIAYLTKVPEGAAMLEAHPAMPAWWDAVQQRASFRATGPAPV